MSAVVSVGPLRPLMEDKTISEIMVYAKALTLMNNKFGSKDVEFVKKWIEFIKTGVAGTEYKDIELVKLEKGNFKTLRFNAKLELVLFVIYRLILAKPRLSVAEQLNDTLTGSEVSLT